MRRVDLDALKAAGVEHALADDGRFWTWLSNGTNVGARQHDLATAVQYTADQLRALADSIERTIVDE